jgi:hypothetical protein
VKKIGTTFCCGNFASLKLERCFAEGKWGRWLAPAEQSSKRPFRSSREGLILRARAPMTKKVAILNCSSAIFYEALYLIIFLNSKLSKKDIFGFRCLII